MSRWDELNIGTTSLRTAVQTYAWRDKQENPKPERYQRSHFSHYKIKYVIWDPIYLNINEISHQFKVRRWTKRWRSNMKEHIFTWNCYPIKTTLSWHFERLRKSPRLGIWERTQQIICNRPGFNFWHASPSKNFWKWLLSRDRSK